MKKKLIIIGAGGNGKVLGDIALETHLWDRVAFLDDRIDEIDRGPFGLDIIGKSSEVYKYIEDWDLFVSFGDNYIREKFQTELERRGAHMATLIHPRSTIGREVAVGRGTAIMAGVVVNSYTRIGKGCIINTGATVDHDNRIDDYVHISPGANLGGEVSVGRRAWVGIGSTVIQGISLAEGCMVGAGGVVVKNIEDSETYIGVPAKRLER